MGRRQVMTPKFETLKTEASLRLKALLAMPNTQVLKSRRFAFLGALGIVALIGLNVTSKPETATAEADVTSAPIEKSAASLIDFYDQSNDITSAVINEQRVKVASGDSLGPLLQKHGVSPNEAYKITQSFSKVYDPRPVSYTHLTLPTIYSV